jgi:ketosteroid isomerase-like protein/TolB-like protein
VAGPAADPVRIRIGLHLGEVVRDGTEVFGDSINIAARLQTIARPGGIALSDDVYRAVRSRMDVTFRDAGMKALKNIRDKVHVYEIIVGEAASSTSSAPAPPVPVPPRLTLIVAAGLAALAVLGGAAYQLALRRPHLTPAAPAPAVVAAPASPTGPRPTAEQPVVVGVMTIAARGDVPDWMRDVTRDGLNTILSRVTGLRVYSRQKIDFLREKQGMTELEAAEKLGIGKMISGALAMDNGDLALELQVVDIASGLLDASERVTGLPAQLIELQNQLAVNVLRTLNIALSPEERTVLFAKRTNDTLESYRMLADTLGGAPKDAPAGGKPPATAPPVDSGRSWFSWPATAAAAEAGGDDEDAIRGVLTEWAAALQAKDLNRVAAVSVTMDDTQRTALARYFESADRLAITLADFDVLVAGDEALATFTRKDSFVDKRSGRDMQLEVRLSSELARQDGRWKMKGIKKG